MSCSILAWKPWKSFSRYLGSIPLAELKLSLARADRDCWTTPTALIREWGEERREVSDLLQHSVHGLFVLHQQLVLRLETGRVAGHCRGGYTCLKILNDNNRLHYLIKAFVRANQFKNTFDLLLEPPFSWRIDDRICIQNNNEIWRNVSEFKFISIVVISHNSGNNLVLMMRNLYI